MRNIGYIIVHSILVVVLNTYCNDTKAYEKDYAKEVHVRSLRPPPSVLYPRQLSLGSLQRILKATEMQAQELATSSR